MLYQMSYPREFPAGIEPAPSDLQSLILAIGPREQITPCEGFEPPYPYGMSDFKSGPVPIEATRQIKKELSQKF